MESKLNKKQRDLMNQFQEFTACRDQKLAITVLNDVKWSVEQAVEVYFTNYADAAYTEEKIEPAPKGKSSSNDSVVEELFSKYSKGEHEITEEGVQEFFNDLDVDQMDPVTLVISYYMGAKNMGEYSKSEFKQGFQALNWSSLAELKSKISTLKKQLKSSEHFPNIYKFVFGFLKGEAARNVNIDHAIAMWDLLLRERYGYEIEPFLKKWTE